RCGQALRRHARRFALRTDLARRLGLRAQALVGKPQCCLRRTRHSECRDQLSAQLRAALIEIGELPLENFAPVGALDLAIALKLCVGLASHGGSPFDLCLSEAGLSLSPWTACPHVTAGTSSIVPRPVRLAVLAFCHRAA